MVSLLKKLQEKKLLHTDFLVMNELIVDMF